MQRSTNIYEIKRIFPGEVTSKTGKIKLQQTRAEDSNKWLKGSGSADTRPTGTASVCSSSPTRAWSYDPGQAS